MSLTPVQVLPEKAEYLVPTWQDLDRLTFQLSKKIRQDFQPFGVVALAKGAWPMSRSLVDYLGSHRLASLGVRFYTGINQRLQHPEIYQEIPVSVKGKHLLLFDDVADTGESLIFAKNHLLKLGAAEVRTASIFLKPRSEILPDYYASETAAWIIFPFERFEMLRLLNENWQQQGVSEAARNERFLSLGFPKNVIHYYFPT
jgi:hypoxanthine phosphoribosyltransferase